ncbi:MULTISPECIES: hypothetical protein [Streptomyces]|uniref:Uncharacterized protein n=1 Tax=Streptomyces evansiae TaxID=3075535 RepID=A0ABU2R8T9_9ACTN|nr:MULTISPECIES: hypothetical protein [unclassified Streptomyces]MDT0412728.1 hypothetical protein [Streptomyces sp. DSM 41979]MYQ56422.1 hypothetical protein [Streptomyces sp. SID4926]SCE48160.1 hypothetical protein GA0115252_15298 [Streptomyces sp. DfronAA-171]
MTGSVEDVAASAAFTAGQAPVSGISVPRHLGVGSDLVHSLDYVVLLQVMFDVASGVAPTPLSVWKTLRERGIRSAKNANELVGEDAVCESFGRLREAGHVRCVQLPDATRGGLS